MKRLLMATKVKEKVCFAGSFCYYVKSGAT